MWRYDLLTAGSTVPANHQRTEGSVIAVIDLNSELAKLPMLRGRRPETTEAERKASGAFVTLAPFRDGNIYSAKFSGDAAWERHPNGDEIVQIVEGATTLHLMMEDGPQSFALSAGMVAIVPQNTWHRFHAPNGVSIVTATPRPTEHLTVNVEDPRTLSDDERAANSEEKVR
jgi:mannose-6-phosphate isomerase-like protein (cupin superfamily)